MTITPVATRPVHADMPDYVNLSVIGCSPTVITPHGSRHDRAHVATPARPPLPRAEHQHAPAPEHDQDDAATYVPAPR